MGKKFAQRPPWERRRRKNPWSLYEERKDRLELNRPDLLIADGQGWQVSVSR